MSLTVDPLLILVHPGSCCGSADFNLGKDLADAGRSMIIRDLERWQGAMLVIDGALSDELPDEPTFATAIDTALARARKQGFVAERILGDDADPFDQVEAALAFVRRHPPPKSALIRLTGAWADEDCGCVTSVAQALQNVGYRTDTLDSALRLT